MGEVFGVQAHESLFDGKFVLSKDTVLRPMLDQARKYCMLLLASEAAVAPDSPSGNG